MSAQAEEGKLRRMTLGEMDWPLYFHTLFIT